MEFGQHVVVVFDPSFLLLVASEYGRFESHILITELIELLRKLLYDAFIDVVDDAI